MGCTMLAGCSCTSTFNNPHVCWSTALEPNRHPTYFDVHQHLDHRVHQLVTLPEFIMFDSDSDSDVEKDVKLTINEHYAKAFEYKKEREELQKCV